MGCLFASVRGPRPARFIPPLSGPSIRGSGAVCSPHSEIYDWLRLTAGFANRRIGENTDGEPMNLSLNRSLNMLGTDSDSRLILALRGAWHNPDLVLEDRRHSGADLPAGIAVARLQIPP
jgi:hypothetical protein